MRKYIGGPKYSPSCCDWLTPQTLDCSDTHAIHTLGLEQLCLRFPKLNQKDAFLFLLLCLRCAAASLVPISSLSSCGIS